jgi:hypothetical protein
MEPIVINEGDTVDQVVDKLVKNVCPEMLKYLAGRLLVEIEDKEKEHAN